MIKYIYLLLILISTIANAEPNFWMCSASDDSHSWSAKSSEQRAATNKALDACKKMSADPNKCTSSMENCDFYLLGKSTRPLWQCMSMDHNAKKWKNSPRPTRDGAALASKAHCQNKSAFPDTCFMILWSCKDLNDYI